MTATKEDFPPNFKGKDYQFASMKECLHEAAAPAKVAMQFKHAIHSTFAVHNFLTFMWAQLNERSKEASQADFPQEIRVTHSSSQA